MMTKWNTQPAPNKATPLDKPFSSYYQYDDTSRKLVRIRLELGRPLDTNDILNGGTGAIYQPDRYVGFSKSDLWDDNKDDEGNMEDWAIEHEKLVYTGKAEGTLSQDSQPDYLVYDTSPEDLADTRGAFVHCGTRVTTQPNLPEGINETHLSLIANDAMGVNRSLILTPGEASPANLSQVIKGEVSVIIGKPFEAIDGRDIQAKLKSQMQEIDPAANGADIDRFIDQLFQEKSTNNSNSNNNNDDDDNDNNQKSDTGRNLSPDDDDDNGNNQRPEGSNSPSDEGSEASQIQREIAQETQAGKTLQSQNDTENQEDTDNDPPEARGENNNGHSTSKNLNDDDDDNDDDDGDGDGDDDDDIGG